MIHLISTLLLGPLLLYQGKAVRRDTPILPEPPGERCGIQGTGKPLSLMVLGDSAAAGVGAGHQDEALTGNLVAMLAQNYRLSWELCAKTGATTASTLEALNALSIDKKCDVIVVSLGVNDVTTGVTLSAWLEQQKALRAFCTQQLGAKLLIVSGLPPVGKFPALPQPLRWYLGRRADQLNNLLKSEIENAPNCAYLNLRFSDDVSMMSSDGFHPGPQIYQQWAAQAAEVIFKRIRPEGE